MNLKSDAQLNYTVCAFFENSLKIQRYFKDFIKSYKVKLRSIKIDAKGESLFPEQIRLEDTKYVKLFYSCSRQLLLCLNNNGRMNYTLICNISIMRNGPGVEILLQQHKGCLQQHNHFNIFWFSSSFSTLLKLTSGY